mmetsp:Transcript_17925/g.37060  ORF Transcript_17925/g.37060 Transcript_17925/m.37060 type:complete len:215 (-) Transcript_17925:68-712(-)
METCPPVSLSHQDHERTQKATIASPPTQMEVLGHQQNNHGPHLVSCLPESLNVLFVDDDTTLRKLFVRALQRVVPNWVVHQAENGETAINLIIKGRNRYDLVFMDQYMASTEKQLLGTEAVQALRQYGVEDCIICGLSANDQERQFLQAGANAFISKPFPCDKMALQKELLRVLNTAGVETVSAEANAKCGTGPLTPEEAPPTSIPSDFCIIET